jgi:hypothetical protein
MLIELRGVALGDRPIQHVQVASWSGWSWTEVVLRLVIQGMIGLLLLFTWRSTARESGHCRSLEWESLNRSLGDLRISGPALDLGNASPVW